MGYFDLQRSPLIRALAADDTVGLKILTEGGFNCTFLITMRCSF